MYAASLNGHVECVQALLDRGAAVNDADVCYCRPMARHCGVCVRDAPQEPVCLHDKLAWSLGCHVVEAFGREVVNGRCGHAWCTGGYEEGA